jgi:hypothetical protein
MKVTNINDLPNEVPDYKGIVKSGMTDKEKAENKRIGEAVRNNPGKASIYWHNVWKCRYCGKQTWITPKSGRCGCGWETQRRSMKGLS